MQYYVNLIYSICVFVIGTLFGSFFTLATYRIPRHQDIVKSRSYCPNCKHKLGFFDCFPILSYISTIGRCKYCKKPISIRYPLIEFASGMVFLIIYLIFGLSWQSLILIICYIYLFLVIGSDIMKAKMTDEEKSLVEKSKNKTKVGAINADIVVAVLVFALFFVSTIFITKNYKSTLLEYTMKSNALNICLNSINIEKAKNMNELEKYVKVEVIDGMEYNLEVEILPYMVSNTEKLNNAKVIVSTVSYEKSGKVSSISLKSIKVRDV